jgi:hypothetical protein
MDSSSLANKLPETSVCGVDVVVERPTPSNARRYTLLLIFCITQFLYTLTNSALFSAIPSLVRKFGLAQSQSVWIISAYQLTFASFLLMVSLVFVVNERILPHICRAEKLAISIILVSLTDAVFANVGIIFLENIPS